MDKIYNHDDMEKLIDKIKKIKKKKNLTDIRDIIINNNPELNITENAYGIHMCFNKLTQKTFYKLDKYIRSMNDKIKTTDTATATTNIEDINESLNDCKINQEGYMYENNSRLKFSNKEKNIIKKRMYDKALKINSEINDYEKNLIEQNKKELDTIFVRKTKKN